MTDQLINQQLQYKVYPQRYLVTSLFALAEMMTSILASTLNPIASQLSIIYHYDPIIINLAGLLYILMHPLFTFPAAYIIDDKGVRIGIIFGSSLILIGITLRLFVNYSFALVLMGQVIAGIGRPFIINCQAKISANWFRANQRGGVTQLLTLVVNVSLVLGILIPGLIFAGYHSTQQNISEGKSLTFKLMLLQAILGFISLIPNLFFQTQKPPTPPSESGDMKREPFKQAIVKLVKNNNYLLLLISFGLYFGLFNAVSITLSFILQPWFGNDPLKIALVGGAPIISGIIGVMIVGPIQRRSKQYKKWILVCMIGSCSAMIIFYPILQTYNLAAVCFVSAYNSFFLIPLVPIMLELGCQLVFPIGQGSAVGLLFAFGNLFGFILGMILSILVDGETKRHTLNGIIFCFGIFVIGLVLTIIMKQQKNRQIKQQQSYKSRKASFASNYHHQKQNSVDHHSNYFPPQDLIKNEIL